MKKRKVFGIVDKTIMAAAIALGYYGTLFGSNNLTKHMNPSIGVAIVDERTADSFILQYKDEIARIASQYNVPPELITATIKSENVGRARYEDWKDSIGTHSGLDTSLGIGQVNISTAQDLDKILGRSFSKGKIISRLQDPKSNIEYIAMFYDNEVHNLGLDARNLLEYPKTIAELASRYVGGRNHKSELARLAGYNVLAYLTDEATFDNFSNANDRTKRITKACRDYICLNSDKLFVRNRRYKC